MISAEEAFEAGIDAQHYSADDNYEYESVDQNLCDFRCHLFLHLFIPKKPHIQRRPNPLWGEAGSRRLETEHH